MNHLLLFLLTIFLSCSVALREVYHPLERGKDKVTFLNINNRLSCDPPLISRWIEEKSDIKKITIIYGNLKLTRSDIGDPDGELDVWFDNNYCRIKLSIMPEVFFSHKDKILLIKGLSGSSHDIEAFDLEDSCKYLGQAELTGVELKVIDRWVHQNDGTKICMQKT